MVVSCKVNPFFFLALFSIAKISIAQTWTQKSSYGGGIIDLGTGFSIGDKGYIGLGESLSASNLLTSFWEYDPVSDTWTQKADFGGVPRCYSIGFSIGSKGYIGTGWGGTTALNDFWEYNPASNTWTQKADVGGPPRYEPAGFSIDGKGYMGTGSNASYVLQKDFWEYDPGTNTWTQKTNFPGTERVSASGFSINDKGYIGIGFDVNGVTKDFWEYNPAYDSWTKKADFGGTARGQGVGFSINSRGFIGTGIDGMGLSQVDFWEYDPTSDTWTQKINFAGEERFADVGFSIGCKGYIGTGYTHPSGGTTLDDLWEYSDTSICNIPPVPVDSSEIVVCPAMYVPGSFTPNNDGTNDVLYVYGSCIESLSFAVYNRWGERVFESGDINYGWDGYYKNIPVQEDAYVYYAKAIFPGGETIEKRDKIVLVR